MTTFNIKHESGKVITYRNITGRLFCDMLRFLGECGYSEIEIDGCWMPVDDHEYARARLHGLAA